MVHDAEDPSRAKMIVEAATDALGNKQPMSSYFPPR